MNFEFMSIGFVFA